MTDEYSQLPPKEKSENPSQRQVELPPEEGVEVPWELIQPSTLEELIKAFVMREGTDYGAVEVSLERKVENVRRQLERAELKLVFDLATETGSIVKAKT